MKYVIFLVIFLFVINIKSQDLLNDQSRLGVFVREIVFKVAPSDAQNWEIAMRKIAEAAKDSKSDELDWLCYSNGSFEYWIVLFADSLKDIPTEFSIVEAFQGKETEIKFNKAIDDLLKTNFEITRDIICQQDQMWSSVSMMNTDTHPKALVTDYWIKPGNEMIFDIIQKDYIKLLKEINYPYPIESFRPIFGAPRVYQVVTFPDNWSSYYGVNNLTDLVKKANREAEYDHILFQLSQIILGQNRHKIDFDKTMSIVPE